MYESPIKLIMQDASSRIIGKQEDDVYRIVMNYGIDVDKDELVRALNYDRQQYKKGYDDAIRAVNNALEKLYQEQSIITARRCDACSEVWQSALVRAMNVIRYECSDAF